MFESTMIPSALPSTSTYTVFLTGKTKCIEVEGDFHVLVIKHTSSYLYSFIMWHLPKHVKQCRKTFFFCGKVIRYMTPGQVLLHVLQKQIMMHINQQANESHRYTNIWSDNYIYIWLEKCQPIHAMLNRELHKSRAKSTLHFHSWHN